jgi:heme/copper-type cytochrome/quinol oxidase subunit 2
LRLRASAILAVAALAVLLLPVPGSRQLPSYRTVRVDAEAYAYTPAVVEVAYGDTVEIELVSNDVVHGIYIEGYDLSVSADPGQTARLRFVADRGGSFRFYCSVSCGPLHPFMSGRLKVGGGGLFWRAAGIVLIGAAALFLVRWR